MSTRNVYLVCLGGLASIAVVVYCLVYAKAPADVHTDSRGPRATESLKFLAVVSRHGSRRSLLSFLPNDTTPWKVGLGELTNVGKIEAYQLGVKIRSLYLGFVNPIYRSVDLHASSTAIDRTLMSGELFLAGLSPPSGFQFWDPQLNWQPIPLYSNSPDKSEELSLCPRYIQERKSAVIQFESDYADNISSICNYVSNHIGFNVSGTGGIFRVWDTLYYMDIEGYALPAWAKEVYPQPLAKLMDRCYVSYVADNPTMTRLLIGLLAQEMFSAMAMKANGSLTPNRQLYYYSGHDSSIIGLQAVLGVPKGDIIGLILPSSALLLELHQLKTGGPFSVQALLINGVLPAQPIDIPGCGQPCDITTFINLTNKYTNIVDYNQECQVN